LSSAYGLSFAKHLLKFIAEAGRKKEEGIKSRVWAMKNVLTALAVAI
jgi:hypothetical protein